MKARILFLAILILAQACSKDEAVISTGLKNAGQLNNPPIPEIFTNDALDRIELDARSSRDPEGSQLSFAWNSDKLVIDNTSASRTFFMIPAGIKDMNTSVTLTVSDGLAAASETLSVKVPVLTQVRAYGLGRELEMQADNSVPYEWYIDQGNSGPYSSINCGPASVTMAIKWSREDFKGTAIDARQAYRSTGGWWYTDDIINYLNDHEVTNRTIALNNMSSVKAEIDRGNVIILCLDMYYIAQALQEEYRLNKFYSANSKGWGHFIVLNGYKIVDGQTLFKAYDPYSLGARYNDQSLKGRDRYYKGSDLDLATQNWWDYAIVVNRKGASTGGRIGVNTAEITHMPGR